MARRPLTRRRGWQKCGLEQLSDADVASISMLSLLGGGCEHCDAPARFGAVACQICFFAGDPPPALFTGRWPDECPEATERATCPAWTRHNRACNVCGVHWKPSTLAAPASEDGAQSGSG